MSPQSTRPFGSISPAPVSSGTTSSGGPFGGVFCARVVEPLAAEQVVRMLAGVRRCLLPGGRFVAATPNPACYPVLTHDFWRDPTHVRFYDVPLLEFLCRQAGLEVEDS